MAVFAIPNFRLLRRGTTVALEFSRTKPDRCLIADTSPPHFVLPYLGLRWLCIKGATSALTIALSDAGKAHLRLATASERSDLPPIPGPHVWIRLTGQNEGEITATFTEGADTLALKVNVLHWRWMAVNFFLVTDPHGTPSFNASETTLQVQKLDTVYRAQAAIDFRRHLPTKNVRVTMDCSLPMTAAQEDAMWDAFRDLTPSGARTGSSFNVFVVKEWGGHDDPDRGYNAWATSHGVYIVIDDEGMANTSPVVPHEIGHSMGLEHLNEAGYVMKQGTTKGWKLKWAHVETVRTYVD